MGIFKKLLGLESTDGETPEFKTFLAASMDGLRLATDAHRGTWHFGEEEQWDFSQDTAEIVFTFPEVVARASAQIVGTLDQKAGTWMWAWGNSTILDSLARDSVQVRAFGQERNIKRLITARWPGEENDAWEMAALTNRICKKNGVYCGPSGTALVFFSFGEIALRKRE